MSMTSLLPFLLLLLLLGSVADAQPSPGYRPSSSIAPIRFFDGYATLWGAQHQSISQDQLSATIWLDKSSGSGFKSTRSYRSGYFGASVKLQGGYTAGVNTAFYLSNDQAYPGFHDEVDMELLGNVAGKPYVLQTNVYVRGSGDGGRLVGREMRFHLWFDPTAGFHHYAILWNPDEIVFLVDDVPIRQYTNKIGATYPQREMWIYSSIWDASSWATENGRYKVDYHYQPFVSGFTNLKIRDGLMSPSGNGNSRGLSPQQSNAMKWAQDNYMIYDYCRDNTKDHSLTPEC